jgi:transposase-like protein
VQDTEDGSQEEDKLLRKNYVLLNIESFYSEHQQHQDVHNQSGSMRMRWQRPHEGIEGKFHTMGRY